jgi:hypothetical protein
MRKYWQHMPTLVKEVDFDGCRKMYIVGSFIIFDIKYST